MLQKSTVLDCEKQLVTALESKNTDLLKELLYDNLIFAIPTGQVVTKEMDLQNLQSGNLKIDSIQADVQDVQLHDNCAITSVKVHLVGSYLDHPINQHFRYIRTWKMIDNQLQVIGGAGIEIQD